MEQKKYEYRRHIAKREVNKIIVYSSFPEKSDRRSYCYGNNCNEKNGFMGINKKLCRNIEKKYREYFSGCDIAYAYKLGEFRKYEKPMLLSDFGLSQAPQSFVYIDNRS